MSLVAVALAPSLFWLWYFWRQDRSTREGAGPMARAFLCGALAVIPAVILELLFSRPGEVATVLECFLVIGPAEELCKFLATLIAIRNEPDFDEPSDGIVAAAAVALGFAFAENLGYFAGAARHLVLVRTLLSVPGHVLFAVFYGAALGRQRCLTGATALTVVQGLFTASILHGLFDALLFNAPLHPLLFLGLFALLVWIQWRMYRKLAAACAAEGRLLRAKADAELVTFEDQPLAASLDPTQLPPPPRSMMIAPPQPFRWGSVLASFCYGLTFFILTAMVWHQLVPQSQLAARTVQLGALCILAMILGGLVSAYRSPGRTVRESAIGLGLLGLLMGGGGSADLTTGLAFAVVLSFLGAFGGWLGEALQGAREGRR